MPKASPALLTALLLVMALAAPASVGGVGLLDSNTASTAPSEGGHENTTRVLRLDEIQASGFGEPRVVVLDAAESQAAELDTRYSLAAVQQRLRDAPNASARRQVLHNYTESAANDVQDLRLAERRARQAYLRGDVTAQVYAQRLAIIHARASALQRFLGSTSHPQPSLWSLTSSFPGLQGRVSYLREELQHLTGPIRGEMAKAIQAERQPIRVFVAASETGFELSYIRDDGTYVRSAYRSDNVDSDSTTAWNYDDILQVTQELYPWALDENRSGPGSALAATPIPSHGTSRITIQHPHGRVVSQVDETTEQVYYEIQYKRLWATNEDVQTIPIEHRFNRTENGTRVLVSRTYPGGPMQVRILNVSDGNKTPYIGNPVTVNGTTRETDFNGVAWFVSPQGEYNITTSINGTEFRFNASA